jgi:hypothetical protein
MQLDHDVASWVAAARPFPATTPDPALGFHPPGMQKAATQPMRADAPHSSPPLVSPWCQALCLLLSEGDDSRRGKEVAVQTAPHCPLHAARPPWQHSAIFQFTGVFSFLVSFVFSWFLRSFLTSGRCEFFVGVRTSVVVPCGAFVPHPLEIN